LAKDLLQQFVTLSVTIDPIGNVPLFLALAGTRPTAELRRMATRAVVAAGVVLLAFVAAGNLLLSTLGISIASFQVAGGIILFRLAMKMIFEDDENTSREARLARRDPAIFPLAIPAMAGPGSILACVVLADSGRGNIAAQAGTGGVIVAVLVIQWALLLVAAPIQRAIGEAGMAVVTRVLGIVLAAMSVEIILTGMKVIVPELLN
jgi:multiple antibiotic resistance protein